MKPTVISLFSGCGGFDLGLEQAGATTIFACDIFKDAVETFKSNFSNIVDFRTDIRKIIDYPKGNIVIGGFPCQGFSVAGKRLICDPRNFLYKEFVRALSIIQPDFFIAENVKGLITMDNGKVINAMISDFSDQGYFVKWELINAKFFGVPQDRERIFIIGVRNDLNFTYEFPTSTHGTNILPFKTMRDTLSHFPLQAENKVYEGGYSSRYLSRNRKRDWSDVSFTIQASGRQAPMHPFGEPMLRIGKDEWIFQGDFNRRLSYEECAAIQTFPNDYIFKGSISNIYKMIGNAVPPLLAENISKSIVLFYS